MIDFACKRIELKEVIKCGLGLSKADIKIMKTMMENNIKWFTSEMLAKKLNLNLSTIQRSLKRMHEKGIIIRRQNNLDRGGYTYMYQIKSKKELIQIINSVVQNWTKNVESELEKW